MPFGNIYQLNEGDLEIFAKVKDDPNFFTDFYFRSETSGTWWRPVEERSEITEIQEIIDRWQRGYQILWGKWNSSKRPEEFEHKDRLYRAVIENDFDHPAFHDHHGFIFLPWQKQLWDAKQTTRVIIGGYGAAKSAASLVCNLIRMATLRQYTCYVVAEYSRQALQVFIDAQNLITGTEFEKRFVYRSNKDTGWTTKPNPKLTVKNNKCIVSTMEFLSIEQNPDKIKNLQGDSFHIEQAEQFNDLDKVMEYLGSRLRGHVGGRERLGIMDFVANSDDGANPQLFDLADQALEDPKSYLYLNPWTIHNIYITPRQLIDIDKRMPKDAEKKDIALKGVRPTGNGEHFSKINLDKCKSPMLDQMMEHGRIEKLPGYILNTQPKAQVVDWCLPPDPTKDYLLVADPGWSNPPARNSAGLMVFDITSFPHIPATLWAFSWIYGNNSPDPWLSKYTEFAQTYRCFNRNAFDGTGLQGSGYEHKLHGLDGLNPWPVNLAGKKFIYLNAAKTLVSRGLFAFPRIPLLFSQMANYRLPDDKLRQDLVMTVVIASAYLDYMFFGFGNEDEAKKREATERYPGHNREGVHTR